MRGSPAVPQSPALVLASTSVSVDNDAYLEWFKCRTSIKLPGSFTSEFWTTLLLQASLSEPAVLHAVLALASVHKGEILKGDAQIQSHDLPDEQERITLRHYGKAIGHLQPHFLAKDKTSLRIALIICIVFVSLELLRGHFETAQVHLRNGLKLLGDMQTASTRNNEVLLRGSSAAPAEDWIVEAFSRLHLHVELFRQTYHHSCVVLRPARSEAQNSIFWSINDAWRQMDRILGEVLYITHHSRPENGCRRELPGHLDPLKTRQLSVKADLAAWLVGHEAMEKATQERWSADEEKCCHLLRVYHSMANIMADTCLRPNDECAFDNCTSQFAHLIKQSFRLWSISSTILPLRPLSGHPVDMSRSVIDVGWIPPLYYTAVKCRVHRLRLQAIKLLESSSHREGIWDSKTAACVARKVMATEERNFYQGFDTNDSFPICSLSSAQDLVLPALPDSHRLREVEIVLSGAPMDKILLFCKRREQGTPSRVLISTYHVGLQRWIEGSG